MTLTVPLVFARLGPAGAPLQPLAGGVAGAVTASHEPGAGSPPPASTDEVAVLDPRLVPARATDKDRPATKAERFAPPIASLTGYRWPIEKGRISLPFKDIPGGTRIRNGKLMHDGVDMASFCGAPVGAAHDGVVLAAGRHFDEQIGWVGSLTRYFAILNTRHMWIDLPNVVVIDDGNGYRSIYAHFRDVTVRVGQHVKAGQLIGHEGATGPRLGLPRPLRLVQPARDEDVRRPGRHPQAPEAAEGRDRADRSAAGPAGRRRRAQDAPDREGDRCCPSTGGRRDDGRLSGLVHSLGPGGTAACLASGDFCQEGTTPY